MIKVSKLLKILVFFCELQQTKKRTIEISRYNCLRKLIDMFAVVPKNNCPHLVLGSSVLSPESWSLTVNALELDFDSLRCTSCSDATENWICLACKSICCSRYVLGHSFDHFLNTSHPIAMSLSDLSVWCYFCESYIKDPNLQSAKVSYRLTELLLTYMQILL